MSVARLAWLVTFVVPLIVSSLLSLAQPAHAASLGFPFQIQAVVGEEEAEEPNEGEVEVTTEDCEEDPVECQEAEETGEEVEETDPYPPAECLLRTARARVFAYSSNERVRLVIRYTSLVPAKVAVAYRLEGDKGSLNLGSAMRRFAQKGLFRLSKHLSQSQAERVETARSFTVQMSIPAAPRYCNRYYTRHLTIKRTVHNQIVWFQSDSIFGTGPIAS